jgi:glycosyltransferase involved in cell wall biosynthesis
MPTTTGKERTPAVSVIIPAYKVAPYIAEAVGSVLTQTYRDFEVIVVNDGSPDTTELEEALAPHRSEINYIRQENRGASAARNTGIKAARAPIVAMLDGDDIWEPHYLEVQMQQIADGAVGVAYGNTLRFGEGIPPNTHFMDFSPSEGDVTYEKLIRLQCNVNASVTAKREALIQAGMYDEEIRTAEDFDLWLRVVKAGWKIIYTRQVLLRARVRADSLSSNQDWMHQDFVTVLKKHARIMTLTDAERKAIADMEHLYEAQYGWYKGVQAAVRGQSGDAIQYLTQANRFYNSWKLRGAIWMLRIAPWLVTTLYRMRRGEEFNPRLSH